MWGETSLLSIISLLYSCPAVLIKAGGCKHVSEEDKISFIGFFEREKTHVT